MGRLHWFEVKNFLDESDNSLLQTTIQVLNGLIGHNQTFLVKQRSVVQRTKFSTWLMSKHWSSRLFADQMAKELGRPSFSTNTIDNWRSGKAMPRGKTMIVIKKISNNELTADDFLLGDDS